LRTAFDRPGVEFVSTCEYFIPSALRSRTRARASAWHGEVLAQREAAVEEGAEVFEAWQDARRRIEQDAD